MLQFARACPRLRGLLFPCGAGAGAQGAAGVALFQLRPSAPPFPSPFLQPQQVTECPALRQASRSLSGQSGPLPVQQAARLGQGDEFGALRGAFGGACRGVCKAGCFGCFGCVVSDQQARRAALRARRLQAPAAFIALLAQLPLPPLPVGRQGLRPAGGQLQGLALRAHLHLACSIFHGYGSAFGHEHMAHQGQRRVSRRGQQQHAMAVGQLAQGGHLAVREQPQGDGLVFPRSGALLLRGFVALLALLALLLQPVQVFIFRLRLALRAAHVARDGFHLVKRAARAALGHVAQAHAFVNACFFLRGLLPGHLLGLRGFAAFGLRGRACLRGRLGGGLGLAFLRGLPGLGALHAGRLRGGLRRALARGAGLRGRLRGGLLCGCAHAGGHIGVFGLQARREGCYGALARGVEQGHVCRAGLALARQQGQRQGLRQQLALRLLHGQRLGHACGGHQQSAHAGRLLLVRGQRAGDGRQGGGREALGLKGGLRGCLGRGRLPGSSARFLLAHAGRLCAGSLRFGPRGGLGCCRLRGDLLGLNGGLRLRARLGLRRLGLNLRAIRRLAIALGFKAGDERGQRREGGQAHVQQGGGEAT